MVMYKVVKRIEGNLISICESQFTLDYQFGKTTIPKIGKMYVFKTIEDAVLYIKHISEKFMNSETFSIVEGESENVAKIKFVSDSGLTTKPELTSDVYLYNSYSISNFWKTKKQHKALKAHVNPAPPNAYVCSSFMPCNFVKGVESLS